MPIVQTALPVSVTTPFGDDKLRVESFAGEEALSSLYRYEVALESDEPALDFAEIVGKDITVSANLADGTERHFSGICTRFVQAGNDAGVTRYHAEIRPKLWLATLHAGCRVFQQQSVIQIVETVLGEIGVSFRMDTAGTYTEREYCVQFRETHFAFISRLLEDAGLFYFFEHTDGAHTLVIADDASKHPDCPGVSDVKYVGSANKVERVDLVTEARLEQNVVSSKVALDDYSFETPSTELLATAEATGAAASYEVHDWAGGHTTKDAGDAVAKRRLEALELTAKLLRGESQCRSFTCGHAFALTKHPREDVNASYVLRRVRHSLTQTHYANDFEAFPAETPFRAQRMTRRPTIPGPQTAKVVGKAGEEIWTDKYGRVKVQFHWDRVGAQDENSSCWVRVAQSWSGKTWGAQFVPRIGNEVVVTFLDGDPDRPLITGMVYNAENMPPYALPTNQTQSGIKTRSSKQGTAGNEIRFEDKKDSEELYLHAQKDMKVEVENDRTTDVKHDETVTVKNKRSVTISEGDESLTVSKGKRTIAVTEGDEAHTVGGKRAVTVTGDETHKSEAKFTHNVTGDYKLVIGGKLEIEVTGAVTIKAGGALGLKTDADLTAEAASALTNKAGTALNNEAGTALTNKAGTALTNEAGTDLKNKGLSIASEASTTMTSKASASHTVESSGIMTVKGSMVKIN